MNDNSGITSQFGFEYQKLVFIYEAMQINKEEYIIYEGQDDIEIDKENPIEIFETSKYLCQTKSGNITPTIFKKILLNWLLNLDKHTRFICVSENDFSFNDDSFADKFAKEIINSNNKENALISRVKDKYTTQKNIEDLKNDINLLLSKAEFLTYNIEKLVSESIKKFAELYCDDTSSKVIGRERYFQLCDILHKDIAESLIKKENYKLSFKTLFLKILSVCEAITDEKYDISYFEFKKRADSKIEEILESQSDAVRQLKLVFPGNDEAVISGLTEQMFYEDLREYFISINKQEEIKNLERVAKYNYDETLQYFAGYGEERTPYKTYYKTVKKNLPAPLPSDRSSSFSFYRHGCYIHLTDTGIDKDLKIKWGEIGDENN